MLRFLDVALYDYVTLHGCVSLYRCVVRIPCMIIMRNSFLFHITSALRARNRGVFKVICLTERNYASHEILMLVL